MAESHKQEMEAALGAERAAQEAYLAGRAEEAATRFREAANHYRRSWELASPTSYGRLIGMMKAAVLGDGGEEEARYAQAQLANLPALTPTAAYAKALAAAILRFDNEALSLLPTMAGGGTAFGRTAAALEALCRVQRERFGRLLAEIVRDFEGRAHHLTGVKIADTALMLQRLGARRGVEVTLHGAAVGAP